MNDLKLNENYYQRYFNQQHNDTQKENIVLLVSIALIIANCVISNLFLIISSIMVLVYWMSFVTIANKLKKIILTKIRREDKLWENENPLLLKMFKFYHIRIFIPACFLILYAYMLASIIIK